LNTLAIAPVALSNGSFLLRCASFSFFSANAGCGCSATAATPTTAATVSNDRTRRICTLPSRQLLLQVFAPSKPEEPRDRERDVGPVGDEEQHGDLGRHEGPHGRRYPLDRLSRDRA